MAILADPRWRALDAQGDAYSGALLYIYEGGGLVPADIFSDPALDPGDALANPLTADANGVFPQFFLAAETFDVVVKTAGGVTLYSSDDLPGVGDSSGVIERDFINSRFKLSGTGGVINLEARPASGDDIGGSFRFGGSDGTQADAIEIDAAAVTVTGALSVAGALDITGAVTFPSSREIGCWKLATGVVAAGASELIVPLTGAYRRYRLSLIDIIPSTSTHIRSTMSVDGGATYKTGSDYLQYYSDLVAMTHTSTGASTIFSLSIGNLATTAAKANTIEVSIITPASGDTWDTGIRSEPRQGAAAYITWGALVGYGRVSHIKVYPNAGTFALKWALYGLED